MRLPRVIPENLPVWRLWLACQTQWRHTAGRPVGLDYAGVQIVAGWLGQDLRSPRLHLSLQAMEDQALDYWRERSKHSAAE